MKLRHLKIVVLSTGGPFEANIPFGDGLVVVRANNTRGKSTCFKSILTALGLEAVLTTSQSELPLTPAVMSKVDWQGQQSEVTESDIYLEIENKSGERITIRRTVKGQRDWHLITVYSGPVLSTSGDYSSKDYFVSRQGAATRDAGFHKFLAGFLGWKMPEVATYEDKECPLYLQLVFPFTMVEQKKGWGTISPPIPTRWRVREPHRRVVEFLLRLDAYRNAIRRQQLHAERNRIKSEWTALHQRAAGIAEAIHGQIQSLPIQPTGKWPPLVPPAVVVSEGDNWISLSDAIATKKKERNQLVNEEIPKVEEIAASAESDLSHLESVVRDREVLLSRLLNTLQLEQEEVEATKSRLRTIKEDLTRNKDARTLRDIGSRSFSDITAGQCPVCHQDIHDSLLPLESDQTTMSLDDNISFLDEQRKTFELVLSDAQRVVAARERQVESIREEISDFRSKSRSLRRTLISDGRLPSEAAIRARIDLENTIDFETEIEERIQDVLRAFEKSSSEWDSVQKELAKLPKADVSTDDVSKIRKLTALLQEQLGQYGFDSLPVGEINVSTDTYIPEHDGFDLQASISASDLIRTIWSYLIGMLELSRTEETNHPGFLMFDEPRQQSANKVSFGELMKRAAKAEEHGEQIIVFTSEEVGEVKSCLGELPHQLIDFQEDRILRPCDK